MAADKLLVDEPTTRPKRGKRSSRDTQPGIDLVRDAYIEAISMSHQLNRSIVLEITPSRKKDAYHPSSDTGSPSSHRCEATPSRAERQDGYGVPEGRADCRGHRGRSTG